VIKLLHKKHKHSKIAKLDHQQHLLTDHTHITKEEFYSRKNEKKIATKKQMVGSFSYSTTIYLHIMSSSNESFLDEAKYFLLEAYYLITSKKKSTFRRAIFLNKFKRTVLFHIMSLWTVTAIKMM
jgi:hypothetical protein